MNLLLVTFSFPPFGGVGVLRALSLAKYLPESGVQVDVLTARNAPAVGRDESLLAQIPSSVTIHRTWTLDLPYAMRKKIKRVLSRGGAAKSPDPKPTAPASPGMLSRVRGVVGDLLLPDPQIGWLPFATSAARRIIKSRKIDAVLVTAPPFSTLLLVPKLRKLFPDLPIIVDFRDEWISSTLALWSSNDNERARAVAHRTEREAVKAATSVVLVTRAAVEQLRKRYPDEPESKFVWVPNGYDTVPVKPVAVQKSPDSKVSFVYLGSVYGSTDPRSFLAAVANLPERLRNSVRFRFVGRIESDVYRDAMKSLDGIVEMVDFLPQNEAHQQLLAADYALLITHDHINVSAKLYDYLGIGVPIFSAVNPAGDVRKLIEETQAGRWADINDVPMMTEALSKAIESAQESGSEHKPNAELIGSYHRRQITRNFASLIFSLGRAPAAYAASSAVSEPASLPVLITE